MTQVDIFGKFTRKKSQGFSTVTVNNTRHWLVLVGQMHRSSTVSQRRRISTTSACLCAARCELDRRSRPSTGWWTTTTPSSRTESRSETTGVLTWCVPSAAAHTEHAHYLFASSPSDGSDKSPNCIPNCVCSSPNNPTTRNLFWRTNQTSSP